MNNQERISRLSPAKRAIFEKRSSGDVSVSVQPQSIPKRNQTTHRLSIEQEQVWFINQLDPNSFFLHISTAYRLVGPLDVEALEKATNEVVRRHETLRTTFSEVGGMPMATVLPSLRVTLKRIDLTSVPEPAREGEMQNAITREICSPFDLSKDILIRPVLLRLAEEEHALLVAIHHIATDRLSVDIFWQELVAIYHAFSKGEPSPLPDLPIQYSDFALWQRQRFHSRAMAEHLAYWKEKLANAPTLNLPTDYPRRAVPIYPGARERWTMPDEQWRAFKALGVAQNTTRFSIFLALFALVVYRYTGEQDLLIGSPVNNRDRAEVQRLIGYFLNTLGLRVDLSGDPSFRELLVRIRRMVLEALAHQDLSISKVLPELKIRKEGNAPIYQVGFVYTNNVIDVAAQNLSLDISALKIFYDSTPMLDIAFGAFDADVGGAIGIDYNTSLFTLATIRRMIGHFSVLLESVLADPDRPISTLPLLTAVEQEQLLYEWNETKQEWAHETLVEAFLAQVKRTPAALAVRDEQQQLSYEELAARVTQLARRLRRAGVGAEVLVGIYAERSVGMMVGLLAVLQAGGAYVPLEKQWPEGRVRQVLRESGSAVVLTEAAGAAVVRECGAQVMLLAEEEGMEGAEREPELPQVLGEQLAYVLYTSGSTGTPKGVMVTHGALLNYLSWSSGAYEVGEGQGTVVHTSLGFDLTVTSLVTGLLVGQCAVLLREEAGVTALGEALRGGGEYSLVKLTPAHLELLRYEVREGSEGGSGARLFVVGGEALWGHGVQVCRDYAPGARVVNEYGPTEATVGCCVYEVGSVGTVAGASVPIGRPIANTQLYVLDEQMQPVPVGIAGELYIGGVGLARGYLRGAELTAARFVPHPYSEEKGARLYRTGDIARYESDGNLQYVGRIDEQVKLRGYRVELGEIENVLVQHAGVQEAVVLLREDKPGQPRLVAYLVPAATPPAYSELRQYCRDRVPQYMVPAAMVMLDALPLTINGKVDREALPVPPPSSLESETIMVPARTPLEAQLVQIWSELLDTKQVGVHDNFFELGGHSLLGVQLMLQLKGKFSVDIPLQSLFEENTVAKLASVIEGTAQETGPEITSESLLVAIQPAGSKPPFFCVHALGGIVFGYHELSQCLGTTQPFYGLQALGLNGEHAPRTQIETMAKDYIEAIRSVQPRGPYRLGGWSMGGLIAYEMAQQLLRQSDEVELLAVIDGHVALERKQLRPEDEAQLLAGFLNTASGIFGIKVSTSAAALQDLSQREQTDYVLEQAEKSGLLERLGGPRQLHSYLEVFRANVEAQLAYVPTNSLRRIVVFRAQDDPRNELYDDSLGWNKLAVEPVEIYNVPGDHYSILSKPNVSVLADSLKACLDEI